MIRLGYFTGKIYDSSVHGSEIQECCDVLDPNEPVDDKSLFILKRRIELRKRCYGCFSCGEAMKFALEQSIKNRHFGI
jgi:hypothetical protein